MSDMAKRPSGEPEEEMSVELELEDGSIVNPSSVVVLGKFRRFHLPIFSLFLPNLVFSYIYGIFSMPFGGFFY